MTFMLHLEPTEKNIEYAEAWNDICMEYAHHFIDDDEFEKKLNELNKTYKGDD